MELFTHDKIILQELGKQLSEIASLPVHKETKNLWKKLNNLSMERPMVMIDQLPWNEMDEDGSLRLQCQDVFCRQIEEYMRHTIFKWQNFPGDMVVEEYIRVPKAYTNSGFGLQTKEHTLAFETGNSVVSHAYIDLLQNEEDLEKIKDPVITYLADETNSREQVMSQVFEGIMPIKMTGVEFLFNAWDVISTLRGVEPVLYDVLDRPDFLHAMMKKFTHAYLSLVDQYEQYGLFEYEQPTVHCTGAWNDELKTEAGAPITAKHAWTFGQAQLFSSVSADMHEEFDITYAKQVYARFGLGYYGCCEPLHKKIDIIRQLPNVRKISISPWADVDIAAENIHGDYVLSNKPNPALLATDHFDEKLVERELRKVVDAGRRNQTSVELILKDVSTIRHDVARLRRWNEIAKHVVQG